MSVNCWISVFLSLVYIFWYFVSSSPPPERKMKKKTMIKMKKKKTMMKMKTKVKRILNGCAFDEPNRKRQKKHNVLAIYSFKDIGKTIASHLKRALEDQSFTIIDCTMLPKGQGRSSESLKAIRESEMYVVVFSPKYAFSKRCLDELVNIVDQVKLGKRKLLPVFFKVNPSDVRKQQGPFKEAFETHKNNFVNPERVDKWRQALRYAGERSGHELQNG